MYSVWNKVCIVKSFGIVVIGFIFDIIFYNEGKFLLENSIVGILVIYSKIIK